MKRFFSCLVFLAACSSKPAPSTPTPPAEPAATEPAPADPAPTDPAPADPAPPDPAATSQCTQQGGRCNNKMAMNVCKRFEEGPAWGCGTNEGCCFN